MKTHGKTVPPPVMEADERGAEVSGNGNHRTGGWETRPLGEVCEILDSKRRPITKRNRVPGPFPYYGATGILDSVAGYLFDEGLVLVGEDGAKWGPGDRSAFSISGKTWVNNHAHVLRPNRTLINDGWLTSYLNFADLNEYISGMTVPKLNQRNLREISVPVPPLPEQKRIVAVLDEAFEGIATVAAHAERNLHNARELFQSVLQSTFEQKGEDWVETTLGEVGSVRTGKKDVNQGNPSGRYPFFTCARDHTYSDSYSFDGDAILIAGNGDVGNVSRYKGRFEAYQRTYVLMDFERVRSSFVYHVLVGLLKPVLMGQRLGNTMPYIKKGMLTGFPLCFPASFEDQEVIIRKLDSLYAEIRRLEAIYERKLAALEELKQSLLHRAFSGKL